MNKRGSLSLKKVLDAAGVTWDKLPSIQKYITPNGKNDLCYNWVMGYCQSKHCNRKHAPKEDVPDVFATGMIDLLQTGFDYMANVEGPAGSKRKSGGGR